MLTLTLLWNPTILMSSEEGESELYHAVVPIKIRGYQSASFDVRIRPQDSVELINSRRSRFNVETYDRYLN